MAAPYNPPVKNQDFVLRVSLSDMASAGSFKANPTIAAGDFKIDKDGAGLVNLATLPVVQPAGSVLVLITLSAAEMNADVVTIVGIDSGPKEWADFVLSIPTVLPGELPTPLSTSHILMPDDAATITMGVPASANGQSILADEYGYLSLNNTDYGGSLSILGYGTTSLFDAVDGQVMSIEWGSHAGLQYFQIGTMGWGAMSTPAMWIVNWNFGTDVTPDAASLTTYVDNIQDIGKAVPTTDSGRPRSIYAGTGVSAAVSMGAGALAIAATRLLLAAGTAAISSMRMLAGVAPSTPTDGDIWFTGTALQMRVGGTTKTITMT